MNVFGFKAINLYLFSSSEQTATRREEMEEKWEEGGDDGHVFHIDMVGLFWLLVIETDLVNMCV